MKKGILIITLCLLSSFVFSQVVEDTIVSTIEDTDTIYATPEVLAQFQGGNEALVKYLSRNLRYPKDARDKGIQGVVTSKFIVEKDGNITNVEITQGIGKSCDEIVTNLVNNMPAWVPAKQGTDFVRSYYTLPVRFELKHKTKSK